MLLDVLDVQSIISFGSLCQDMGRECPVRPGCMGPATNILDMAMDLSVSTNATLQATLVRKVVKGFFGQA